MFHAPNKYRITNHGRFSSTDADGNNGVFRIPIKDKKGDTTLLCIISDGMGWEHVSTSHHLIIPKWEWMCQIKDIFWDEDDVVVQYHPAKKDYINNHPRCLHLWRSIDHPMPSPPSIMVGISAT